MDRNENKDPNRPKKMKHTVQSMDDIFTLFKTKKFNLSDMEMIMEYMVEFPELILEESEAVPDIEDLDYSVKNFALTLYYFSTDAYNYLRETFRTSLPDAMTLARWLVRPGGKTGFTEEILKFLKAKASSKPILATLSIGNVNLSGRVSCQNDKEVGYLDIGAEIDSDILPEARTAIVFSVTAVNDSFEVPVGYFLTDYETGERLAYLVNQCLRVVHEAGVKVIALAIEPVSHNSHPAMARALGCDLKTGNVKFLHPITNEEIVILADPCRALHLLALTLKDHKIILDEDGKPVNWKQIEALKKQRNKELKEKVETQMFQMDVADAMARLRAGGNSAFIDSEATEKFLRLGSQLAEIFSSKEGSANKPLSEDNVAGAMEVVNKVMDYACKLKSKKGDVLASTFLVSRFYGFYSCDQALRSLYSNLVEGKKLECLALDKFSYSHLRGLFKMIWQHCKCEEDGEIRALQFITAYKKAFKASKK